MNEITGLRHSAAIPAAGKPATAADAAKQFESLLITQLLKSAREGGSGGWLGSGDGGDSSPALEFAEQQLASMLSNAGGLGLSTLVAEGLNRSASGGQKE